MNINCGFLGIDDIGSGIHQFRALRVISHATSKLAFASACAFVRFGTLTTAPLAKYDDTGRNSTHFFFAIHHTPIALDASYLLSSTLRQTLHRHLHRHRTRRVAAYCTTSHCLSHVELRYQSHEARRSFRRVLLAIVLAAGIILTSVLTSYSSRPTDAIHAAGILIDIVRVASHRIAAFLRRKSAGNTPPWPGKPRMAL